MGRSLFQSKHSRSTVAQVDIELVWHSAKEYIANRLFKSIEELEVLLHKLLIARTLAIIENGVWGFGAEKNARFYPPAIKTDSEGLEYLPSL